MSQGAKFKKFLNSIDPQFVFWIFLVFFSTYLAIDNLPALVLVQKSNPAIVAGALTFSFLLFHIIAKGILFQNSNGRDSANASSRNTPLQRCSDDRIDDTFNGEEILGELTRAFGDLVVHRNQRGKIVYINESVSTYFGDGFEDALPRPLITGIVEGSSRQKTRDLELETLFGPRWFTWSDIIIRVPQTDGYSIASLARDITEWKETEKALKEAADQAKSANDAKSQFLAMVSHEIRTPLNGVIGMAQLLQNSDLQPAQLSYIDAILTSGHSLNHLIDDLLDTAQIESGNSELCPRSTNITNLVEGVAEILSSRARDNGLALATFIDPQIPQTVDVDSGRLRQVLLNLAGNATKFTQRGGVAIHVRLADQPIAGSNTVDIQFCVADSGPGIAQDDQENIFNEFIQLDDGATRRHGGAGLGLAISQNIVKLMGGTIRIQSETGKGARFLFNIILPAETDKQQIAAPANRTVSIILPRTPARQAIAESTRSLGYTVETFHGLSSFVNRSSRKHEDHSVIVAHEGIEASVDTLHQLKSNLEDGVQLLLLGDAVQRQNVGPLLEQGFDGWLTWPVRSQTLSNVLNQTTIQAQTVAKPKQEAHSTGKKFNVLLAEDNQINALLTKTLFANLGHQVTHVLNGQEAIDQATSGEEFHMIFMDLHMPLMDGTAAIREIRKFEKQSGNSRCPIVVLSADGQSGVRDSALACGADDYLTKPLNVDDLAVMFDSP